MTFAECLAPLTQWHLPGRYNLQRVLITHDGCTYETCHDVEALRQRLNYARQPSKEDILVTWMGREGLNITLKHNRGLYYCTYHFDIRIVIAKRVQVLG